jgi:hypothetical protein
VQRSQRQLEGLATCPGASDLDSRRACARAAWCCGCGHRILGTPVSLAWPSRSSLPALSRSASALPLHLPPSPPSTPFLPATLPVTPLSGRHLLRLPAHNCIFISALIETP